MPVLVRANHYLGHAPSGPRALGASTNQRAALFRPRPLWATRPRATNQSETCRPRPRTGRRRCLPKLITLHYRRQTPKKLLYTVMTPLTSGAIISVRTAATPLRSAEINHFTLPTPDARQHTLASDAIVDVHRRHTAGCLHRPSTHLSASVDHVGGV